MLRHSQGSGCLARWIHLTTVARSHLPIDRDIFDRILECVSILTDGRSAVATAVPGRSGPALGPITVIRSLPQYRRRY